MEKIKVCLDLSIEEIASIAAIFQSKILGVVEDTDPEKTKQQYDYLLSLLPEEIGEQLRTVFNAIKDNPEEFAKMQKAQEYAIKSNMKGMNLEEPNSNEQ